MPFRLFILSLLLPAVLQAQTVDTVGLFRQVDSLLKVSRTLTDNKDYEQAMDFIAQAEKLVLEKQGEESVLYARVCSSYGRLFHTKAGTANYLKAEEWVLKAKNIREKLLGTDHPDYASSVYGLALIYKSKGQYKDAVPLFQEAISIREKALGKEHQDYLSAVLSLVNMYMSMAEPDRGLPLALEVLAIQERTLGKEHADYAETLNVLGLLYSMKSDYNKSLSIHTEVLRIREKVLGKNDPSYAYTLNNLATELAKKGQYERALEMCSEARSIMLNTLGKDNLNYAIMLRTSGHNYTSLSRYDEAEAAYKESAAIIEKLYGKEHPYYSNILNSLTNSYRNKGDYRSALATLTESKNIEEKVLGTAHPRYAAALLGLSKLYKYTGEYAQALSTATQARDIFGNTFGKESADYGSTLLLLSEIYGIQGLYDEAIPLLMEAKNIREKLYGKAHKEYASCLNQLARLYQFAGAYDKAIPLYLEAGRIWATALGTEHNDYISMLANLALAYKGLGDIKQASHYFYTNNLAARSLIRKAAVYSSEEELLRYQAKYIAGINLFFQYTENYPNDSLLGAAYNTALYFNNGLLFNALARSKSMDGADSDTRSIYEEWKACHFQLAKLYSSPLAKRNTTLILTLEGQAEAYEKELTRRSASFVSEQKDVSWEEVQKTLKPDEAAIEFVSYQVNIAELNDSVRYAALLIRPGYSHPQIIPLFWKSELLPLLRGTTGGNNFMKINALYSTAAPGSGRKSAYELIWKPLEQSLKGVSTIYYASSGLLYYLNLGAIPAANGKTVGDNRQLMALGSTRSLVTPNNFRQSSADAYLAGGIRYETDSIAVSTANHNIVSRGDESISSSFQTDSVTTRSEVLNYLRPLLQRCVKSVPY